MTNHRCWLLVLPALLLALTLVLPTRPISGRVVDTRGQPLAGATVRWQATAEATTSDAQGRFLLAGRPWGGRLTASREGYFIAGLMPASDDPVEFVLRPLPEDHADYAWVDPDGQREQPGNCASCHREIAREWSASGHARSVTGRFFRDLYEGTDSRGRPGVSWGVLTQNEPGAAVCVSCHAPAVRDDEPGALDLRHLAGGATRGVHCDYCHKVEGLTGPIDGLSHGRFNLRLRRPDPATGEQLFFGPLDDVDRGDDVFSSFQKDSQLCAACHEGVVFGVHAYGTYSEWLASPANRQGISCQRCHMAPTGRMTNLAPGRGGKERDPATLANHRFFADSQEAMLRRALSLEASTVRVGDDWRVTLVLTAQNIGHRLPTGYIDRHLVLVVEAMDEQGQPVEARTGPRLPALAGSLAGRPGKLFAKSVSDHQGHRPGPFWASRHDAEDTRLQPERPETWTWTFPASSARTLSVRILYRRFWEEVARAKGWGSVETVVQERKLDLTTNHGATGKEN